MTSRTSWRNSADRGVARRAGRGDRGVGAAVPVACISPTTASSEPSVSANSDVGGRLLACSRGRCDSGAQLVETGRDSRRRLLDPVEDVGAQPAHQSRRTPAVVRRESR